METFQEKDYSQNLNKANTIKDNIIFQQELARAFILRKPNLKRHSATYKTSQALTAIFAIQKKKS